jgi:hypothetical protein
VTNKFYVSGNQSKGKKQETKQSKNRKTPPYKTATLQVAQLFIQ